MTTARTIRRLEREFLEVGMTVRCLDEAGSITCSWTTLPRRRCARSADPPVPQN
jgi:hypothetical protein